MRYIMTVTPVAAAAAAAGAPAAVRVAYAAAVDTATLPLPPPIRAVVEASMAASFHALVTKFVAFAAAQLGGELVEEGGVVVGGEGAKVGAPHTLSPRAAASPRVLAPPAPGAAATWAPLIPSRHVRIVHQDTEGREYWDAAETPRGLDAVWEGGGGGGGTVPGTPTAAAAVAAFA